MWKGSSEEHWTKNGAALLMDLPELLRSSRGAFVAKPGPVTEMFLNLCINFEDMHTVSNLRRCGQRVG